MGESLDARTVLKRLQRLSTSQRAPRSIVNIAQERAEAVKSRLDFIESHSHPIAFIGQVGVGKSSMIAVASGLMIGDPPQTQQQLREASVLAIASGRTTICEVRIRPPNAGEVPWQLLLDPCSAEEMREEIQLFAEEEWRRRRGTPATEVGDGEPTPEEIQRAIRAMTSYKKQHQTYEERGRARRRVVDPLHALIDSLPNAQALVDHLVERARLEARERTRWEWADGSEGNLREMQRVFYEVNHGEMDTAMLPRRITLVKPDPLPGRRAGDALHLELVDTRGFDGFLAGREDIQEVLLDPRALIVVCIPFKEAPGDTVRELLKDIRGDARLSGVEERTLLVLLDHNYGQGVNGAEGDRLLGQDIKEDECRRHLEGHGLEMFAQPGQIEVFDVLQDDRSNLVNVITERLLELRSRAQRELDTRVHDGITFLELYENDKLGMARQEVDQSLAALIEANAPKGTPQRHASQGLTDTLNRWRHASQVYASCRRKGYYPALNAYAAVEQGAAESAAKWLAPLDANVKAHFRAMKVRPDLREVGEHIRLREQQYAAARKQVIDTYARNLRRDVETSLSKATDTWSASAREWGQGPGFRDRVVGHIEAWQRRHDHQRFGSTLDPRSVLPQVRKPVE